MSKLQIHTLAVAASLVVCGSAWAVAFPGPDSFGYTGSEIANNLRDIRGSGTQINLFDDQVTGAIPIGFSFNFYGNGYSNVYVSSNGFMTFTQTTDTGCCFGEILGNSDLSGDPDNLVAGLWEDLDSNNNSTGTMYYQTIGSEFIVGFYGVAHFPSGLPVTFEMILHQGSNNIELQYGLLTDESAFHTIGIGNIGDTDALTLLNQGGSISSFSDRGFCIEHPNSGSACAATVPEPGTVALLSLALFGLAARRRLRRV